LCRYLRFNFLHVIVMDLPNLVRSILDKGYVMSLGTVDESGPWVTDLIFVHDNAFILYWISDVSVRHSLAIKKNPSVAVAVSLTNLSISEEVGVQIMGRAEKLTGDFLEIAVKHRIKRGMIPPKKEGDILGSGESWYALYPSKIDIIHTPLFGTSKKELIL
jgi:uncharacterized protein YhbP (UPF0306 family)